MKYFKVFFAVSLAMATRCEEAMAQTLNSNPTSGPQTLVLHQLPAIGGLAGALPNQVIPELSITNVSVPTTITNPIIAAPAELPAASRTIAARHSAIIPRIAAPNRGLSAGKSARIESKRTTRLSAVIQPDLKTAQDDFVSPESGRLAAERMFTPFSKKGPERIIPVPAAPEKSRYAPLVNDISFIGRISGLQRTTLMNSLSRRKTAWTRELARVGLKFDGPSAPAFTVKSAESGPARKGETTVTNIYTIEWAKGETQVGAFKAYIPGKTLAPKLLRLADPQAPKEKQFIIRFRNTVIRNMGGINIEASVTEDEIAGLFLRSGLQVVTDYGNRTYKVASFGPEPVDTRNLANLLAGNGMVESAMAVGTLSDDEIVSSANHAISYKGKPWSATEYNVAYATAFTRLEMRGATPAQLQKFKELCAAAPVKGGGFNPWSGD